MQVGEGGKIFFLGVDTPGSPERMRCACVRLTYHGIPHRRSPCRIARTEPPPTKLYFIFAPLKCSSGTRGLSCAAKSSWMPAHAASVAVIASCVATTSMKHVLECLSFHLCVSPAVALYRSRTGVCPVGSSVERGSSGWSRVPRAAGSVARVCRLTPLCSRTTLCLLSLLHHRGGGSVCDLSRARDLDHGCWELWERRWH
jgi:hypothetical protein